MAEATVRKKIDPTLNSIKEKMSIAYMYGMNSTVNYVFSPADKDMDGLGIDLTIINKTVGTSRKAASESNTVNVQLKGVSVSSASMIAQTDTEVTYTLSEPLNPIGTHYLVIVVLPDEAILHTWREVSPESLSLRACAYYKLIDTYQKAGKIKIPKTNLLTPESYRGLFDAAKMGASA
jgi:hypothetical protein